MMEIYVVCNFFPRTEAIVKYVNGRLLRGKDGLNILRSYRMYRKIERQM